MNSFHTYLRSSAARFGRCNFKWLALTLLFTAIVYLPFVITPDTCAMWEDWDWLFATQEGVRKIIADYGQFPYWDPWHFGGNPAFSDPQIGIFSLDCVCNLIFGVFYGMRISVYLHVLFGAAGMYLFMRDYVNNPHNRFWGAVLFSCSNALALHVVNGHFVMSNIVFLPWCMWTIKRLHRSVGYGCFFGFLLAMMMNHSMQYLSLMTTSVLCIAGGIQAWRHRVSGIFYQSVTFAVLFFLAFGAWRVIVTLCYLLNYPRIVPYAMRVRPTVFLRALMDPFVSCETWCARGYYSWKWHETACYTGMIAFFFCARTFFRKWTRFQWILLVLLLLSLDNKTPFLPGYWLHKIPPFTAVFAMTRWRFYFLFFLALTSAKSIEECELKLPERKRFFRILRGFSCAGLLASHIWIHYFDPDSCRVSISDLRKSMERFPSGNPILSVVLDTHTSHYVGVLDHNYSILNGYQSLLGYDHKYVTGHPWCTDEKYTGEYLTSPGQKLIRWTPEEITITADREGIFCLNQNPGRTWRNAAGDCLFPEMREFEPEKPFTINLPAGTHVIHNVPIMNRFAQNVSLGAFLILAVVLLVKIRLHRQAKEEN